LLVLIAIGGTSTRASLSKRIGGGGAGRKLGSGIGAGGWTGPVVWKPSGTVGGSVARADDGGGGRPDGERSGSVARSAPVRFDTGGRSIGRTIVNDGSSGDDVFGSRIDIDADANSLGTAAAFGNDIGARLLAGKRLVTSSETLGSYSRGGGRCEGGRTDGGADAFPRLWITVGESLSSF